MAKLTVHEIRKWKREALRENAKAYRKDEGGRIDAALEARKQRRADKRK